MNFDDLQGERSYSNARLHDQAAAARLWTVSEDLTGVEYAFPR